MWETLVQISKLVQSTQFHTNFFLMHVIFLRINLAILKSQGCATPEGQVTLCRLHVLWSPVCRQLLMQRKDVGC